MAEDPLHNHRYRINKHTTQLLFTRHFREMRNLSHEETCDMFASLTLSYTVITLSVVERVQYSKLWQWLQRQGR